MADDYSMYRGGLIDEPGPLAPLEEWQRFYAKVESFVVHPDTEWWKASLLRSARSAIAIIDACEAGRPVRLGPIVGD